MIQLRDIMTTEVLTTSAERPGELHPRFPQIPA
jgi:hypothetical protein